jgi:hypothetical protein
LSCAAAEAQQRVAPMPIPALQLGAALQQVVASRITLVVASGRIVHPGTWPAGQGQSNASLPGGRESLSFSSGTNGSLKYRRVGPQGNLTPHLFQVKPFGFHSYLSQIETAVYQFDTPRGHKRRDTDSVRRAFWRAARRKSWHGDCLQSL